VIHTIQKYGILEDIYNFHETGFMMGVLATQRLLQDLKKLTNHILHSLEIENG
jgi:hypothetical protein